MADVTVRARACEAELCVGPPAQEEPDLSEPEEVEVIADSELRDAAEVLASKADLSVTGASEAELSKAIEDGINTLREIYGVGD